MRTLYADAHRLKTLILSGVEFTRRFLLHLLPQGFTKIRHYGLLGNNRRKPRVALARTALESSPLRFAPKTPSRPITAHAPLSNCPHCQGTQLRCIGRADRWGAVTFFTRALLPTLAPLYSDSS